MVNVENNTFDISGPIHLSTVDWSNPDHCRSVSASLVQGVYVLEQDRQLNFSGKQVLAPPWWESFHFELFYKLVDDDDSSIFGAVFKFRPPMLDKQSSSISVDSNAPRYVIAFRGTIPRGDSLPCDLKIDLHLIRHGLHQTSRCCNAISTVRDIVAKEGGKNVWLTGHSLGAAIALFGGKQMAIDGIFLPSFLFNPPFVAAPIERIKNTKVRHGLRVASSVITAGLALAVKTDGDRSSSLESFSALSSWSPHLFVNRADHICAEYIGYFEHRRKMEEIGVGAIERLATHHSIGCLLFEALGRETEASHLLPSANLTINLSSSENLKKAHGIHQWWRSDVNLQTKKYSFA